VIGDRESVMRRSRCKEDKESRVESQASRKMRGRLRRRRSPERAAPLAGRQVPSTKSPVGDAADSE
jgi:hypothetical protein